MDMMTINIHGSLGLGLDSGVLRGWLATVVISTAGKKAKLFGEKSFWVFRF